MKEIHALVNLNQESRVLVEFWVIATSWGEGEVGTTGTLKEGVEEVLYETE